MNQVQFVCPAEFSWPGPDEIVVSFRDFPESLTSGASWQEGFAAAIDALEEAVAGRIADAEEIPPPSKVTAKERAIPVPPRMAAKAALALALRDSGLSQVAFAAALGVDEKSVRRMLDPRHGTAPNRIDKGLRTFGQRIVVQVQAA